MNNLDDYTKTIYEKLNMYSRNQIDESVMRLTKKERNFLLFRFDGDLDNNYINPYYRIEDDKYYYFVILPRIKQNIESKLDKPKKKTLKSDSVKENRNEKKFAELITKRNDKKLKTIYQKLDKYPRELVNEVLGELDEKDKALIFLMNGNDLDNPVRGKIDKKTQASYNSVLIPKIEKRLEKKVRIRAELENKRNKTIFELCEGYSKELIYEALNELDSNEKVVIALMNGNDLDNPKRDQYLVEETEIEYYKIINKLNKRLEEKTLKENKQRSKEYKDFIIKELNVKTFLIEELIKSLTVLEIHIIYMKLLNISNNEIANKLGITIEEVNQVIKDFYIRYRNAYMETERDSHTKKLLK